MPFLSASLHPYFIQERKIGVSEEENDLATNINLVEYVALRLRSHSSKNALDLISLKTLRCDKVQQLLSY